MDITFDVENVNFFNKTRKICPIAGDGYEYITIQNLYSNEHSFRTIEFKN